MKAVQIIGPSYSGSTVLGYALNTVNGYFFGSEVRRLLVGSKAKKPAKCDICVDDCTYWSTELRAAMDIADATDLNKLYSLFAERHPDIDVFVDASKNLDTYRGTTAYRRIASVKHPIKLLASTLYNDHALGINVEGYEAFQSALEANASEIVDYSCTYFKKMEGLYRRIHGFAPDSFLFKADFAHKHDFSCFRQLERFLTLPPCAVKPARFSEFPCHSLGGNRAPLWVSQGLTGQEYYKLDSRKGYYARAESIGDWKIDRKYLDLLGPEIISKVQGRDEYHSLCDYLDYDPADPEREKSDTVSGHWNFDPAT